MSWYHEFPDYFNSRLEDDAAYFLHKVKGAIMYVGGTGEIENMRLEDFIDTCYRNNIHLGCKIVGGK